MNKMRLLTPYLLFFTLAIFWSFSFLGIRVSITFFSPIFAATLRVAVAFLGLSVAFFFMKTPLRLPWKIAAPLWFQGIIGQALPFLCLFWGEQYVAPGLASIINATVPLWVLAINGFILLKKGTFTVKKTLGLLLGFTGITIIFAPMISMENTTGNSMILIGILSISAMAIFYSISAIFYQKLCTQTPLDFKSSVWHQHIGSLTFLILFSLFTNAWPQTNQLSNLSFDAILAIIYLGIFSTAMAYLIYSYLIGEWGAVRVVSVLYIVPIFSVLWDFLFLQIHIYLYELIGMAIILLGVFFVQRPDES